VKRVTAYYNESDSFAARWLRELIADGLIADGEVDERSIVDVRASELRGYSQHHFFAGIGGWSCALRLADWPDDRPVWTGSVPCQPLSSAGQRKGHADERHLWPAFHRLIAECRPPTIFGEQVASKLGREWFSGVRADLEGLGYACGAADLCAASVGAPHIRQRLWWVADAGRQWLRRERQSLAGETPGGQGQEEKRQRLRDDARDGRDIDGLADAEGTEQPGAKHQTRRSVGYSTDGRLGHANVTGRQARDTQPIGDESRAGKSSEPGSHDGLGNTEGARLQGQRSQQGTESERHSRYLGSASEDSGLGNADNARSQGRGERFDERPDQCTAWSSGEFIPCADGKARLIEPGIQPLAHGIPNRVGTLRGAGNAIVPQVAAEFVKAFTAETGPQVVF
jgi:DNA (cytosine-5)-methyltransferase 1